MRTNVTHVTRKLIFETEIDFDTHLRDYDSLRKKPLT